MQAYLDDTPRKMAVVKNISTSDIEQKCGRLYTWSIKFHVSLWWRRSKFQSFSRHQTAFKMIMFAFNASLDCDDSIRAGRNPLKGGHTFHLWNFDSVSVLTSGCLQKFNSLHFPCVSLARTEDGWNVSLKSCVLETIGTHASRSQKQCPWLSIEFYLALPLAPSLHFTIQARG